MLFNIRSLGLLLTVVLLLTFVTAVQAGKQSEGKLNNVVMKRAFEKAAAYDLDGGRQNVAPISNSREPLVGTSYSTNASPGVPVGYTYYDFQHNASIGRMVETGPHTGVTGPTMVHFAWMYAPDSLYTSRSYAYNAYNSNGDGWAGVAILHNPEDEYSGYVNVDVTPDNRGIVGGHSDQNGPISYMAQFHFDACSGCEDFAAFARIPDEIATSVDECDAQFHWPKFFLQFGSSGVDTVLHVIANSQCPRADAEDISVAYFRYLGYEGQGAWDPDPFVVDTVTTLSADITGQRMGNRVCLTWFPNTSYQEGCDTCSGPTPEAYRGLAVSQMDNDMYFQVSNDQGTTWEPRENVTMNAAGEAGWKAYCASSALFDQSGNLHVVWSGFYWDADPNLDLTFNGGVGVWWYTRLFHWSENVPYVRTMVDQSYPVGDCQPPVFAAHIDKPSLSECDGKLYCLFTQFNDMGNGIDDDCAAWVDQSVTGATNGELWVTVSSDMGMTWDIARNLTNTYTPGCDPSHGGDDCASDYWPSMSRWGRQLQGGEIWTDVPVVDPDPYGYSGDYYLEVFYVEDLDAGGGIRQTAPDNELGSRTFSPLKWFRLACVEPVPNPIPIYSLARIDDPAWAKPGVQVDTPLTIENVGNVALEYVIALEEDNGAPGWLAVSGFSGSVGSGLTNLETGTIHLNYGGAQTDYLELIGRIIFTDAGNSPSFPDTIPVNFFVVDTIVSVVWDTIYTNCLSLAVSNNGNAGHSGQVRNTMDYYNAGDCDTTANVYLFDGSPVVGWIDGDDTLLYYDFWNATYLYESGLRPQGGEIWAGECGALDGADFFQSGTFSTIDSSLGMTRAWVAPSDQCPWVLEYLKVWSYDGATHAGVVVGEVIDWDIPWDFLDADTNQVNGATNIGGIDTERYMVYQIGNEATNDDTLYPFDCQLNSDRYGGNAFVDAYYNGGQQPIPFMGAVVDNDITQATAVNGLLHQETWNELTYAGLRTTDSISDLHTIMGFHNNLTIGTDDVYEVVTVLATVQNGDVTDLQAAVDAAKAWYASHGGIAMFADADDNGMVDACEGCCQNMGDLDDTGTADGMDVVYFVDWLWNAGPDPVCMDEANVDGVGEVDAMDLVYMVDWLWGGGGDLASCP